MPRSFKYLGAPTNLGRFGAINTGDIVDLRICEEKSVADNEEFTPVSTPDEAPQVALKGTNVFDLRRVAWDARDLPSEVVKYAGSQMFNLVVAMNLIGCNLNVYEHQATVDVADNIAREAIRNGWDKLDAHARMECPVVSDEDEAGEGDDDGEGDELPNDLTEGGAGDGGEPDEADEEAPADEAVPTAPKRKRKK